MKHARKSLWGLLYKFHRYSGLLVAVFLVVLSATGIALNHTDDLQLDKRFITSGAVLDWYGISAPAAHSFNTVHHWMTQLESQIYLDRKLIVKHSEALIGAVETENFVVLAFTDALLMFTREGELIEHIQQSATQIGKVGLNRIVVKNESRQQVSEDGLISWRESNEQPENWSQTTALPENIEDELKNAYLGNILPYERVLLDLHSGRFFGRFGVIFIDICAIFIILIAISGCWIWLRHKLKSRRRIKSRKT